MPREQRFRPAVNVERLEGRELTTRLSSTGAGLVVIAQRPQVEVRTVTAENALASHNYFTSGGFFRS
jgi:hypothetical protein